MTSTQPKSGQRPNLLIVAKDHFPRNMLVTSMGVASLCAPFLFNYFLTLGVGSVAVRVALTALVLCTVPVLLLYTVTLCRAPTILKRKEVEAEAEIQAVAAGLEAVKAKEQKEERQIVRLEQVLTEETKIREEKDEKEDERWAKLNERLNAQVESGKHTLDVIEKKDDARQDMATEENLLVAKQIKDLKTEHEVERKSHKTEQQATV